MAHNEIRNIRPTSKFDTYKPSTPIQTQALETMKTLASQIVSLKGAFERNANPFASGSMFILSGGPGRGKSHLLEAFVNDVAESAPALVDKMFLLRRSLSLQTVVGVNSQAFDQCPIVLIDDLFSEHQSISNLSQYEVKVLSEYIAFSYENRIVTIATCNFPFMDGILDKIKQHDKVGRIASRCEELVRANSGEFMMDGSDYRTILANEAVKRRQSGSGFGLPMLGKS